MNHLNYSIIVPVYNVSSYLDQCAESILSQTNKYFELLLIDDGSSDASAIISDDYAMTDDRVITFHKKNAGLSSARNAGIDLAIGSRVLFVDSDDYWTCPELLQYIADNDISNNMILWKYQRCFDNNTISIVDSNFSIIQYDLNRDYRTLFRKGILFASACYMAIPGDWFCNRRLRFAEGDTSEDVEWFAELLTMIDKITLIDSPVYAYRIRSNSISNVLNKKNLYDLLKHVNNISINIDTNSMVTKTFLAEQTANYIIVLSRYSYSQRDINNSMNILPTLKHVTRKRSKFIKTSVSLFGLHGTLRLLQFIDRII